MNVLKNHKNGIFESYDFLCTISISFWAYICPVNILYFALDERGNWDFKSVFIIYSICFMKEMLYMKCGVLK